MRRLAGVRKEALIVIHLIEYLHSVHAGLMRALFFKKPKAKLKYSLRISHAILVIPTRRQNASTLNRHAMYHCALYPYLESECVAHSP